jgi:plastocyanin
MHGVSRALREVFAGVAAAIMLLAFASTASAASAGDITLNGTRMLTGEKSTVTTTKLPNGGKRLKYEIGPFKVIPGQNEIGYTPITAKPQVDGYITRMRPDLTYLNGTVPRVDVLHLHHGVWVNMSRPNSTNNLPELFFAAGEEKTIFQLPKGYGYRYEASDGWLLNHMIHNLTPVAKDVVMVYEIDFIPDSSAAAKKMKPARPIWMDVESGKLYPVFNVMKNSGEKNIFTYPNDDPNAYPAGTRQRNAWTVDRDGVLLATAGHLHPGGLHTDLWLQRNGAKVRAARCGRLETARAAKKCRAKSPRGRGSKVHLFRSDAKYYEPAGAVSWDVAMTATRPDWKVRVKKGDVLTTTATYGTKRAAWWESMGIMVAYMADEARGKNPYRTRVDLPGKPTHGHLRENRNHGGKKTTLPDARKLKDGSLNPGEVDVLGFNYRLGDLRLPGLGGRPPVVSQGQSLTFVNQDTPQRVYHSITSCKAPCNKSTGIAYPIADGPVQFESGTLGDDRPITTGNLSWSTPKNLKPGTYTYFCRIHPFMRGAFRVKN